MVEEPTFIACRVGLSCCASSASFDFHPSIHRCCRAMAPKPKPEVPNCDGAVCSVATCQATACKSWWVKDGADGGRRSWCCAGNSGTAHRNARKGDGWRQWDGKPLPQMPKVLAGARVSNLTSCSFDLELNPPSWAKAVCFIICDCRLDLEPEDEHFNPGESEDMIYFNIGFPHATADVMENAQLLSFNYFIEHPQHGSCIACEAWSEFLLLDNLREAGHRPRDGVAGSVHLRIHPYWPAPEGHPDLSNVKAMQVAGDDHVNDLLSRPLRGGAMYDVRVTYIDQDSDDEPSTHNAESDVLGVLLPPKPQTRQRPALLPVSEGTAQTPGPAAVQCTPLDTPRPRDRSRSPQSEYVSVRSGRVVRPPKTRDM